MSFTAPHQILPGPCVLECDFQGVLNDKLRGFYRSTFRRRRGQGADSRGDPVRVDRRQAGLPLLGRAGPKGGVLRHPRGRRRPAGDLERRRAVLDGAPGRQAPRVRSPTRSRCRPTSSPSSSAPWRRPSPVEVDGTALRVVTRARQGPPDVLRRRGGARTRCATSPSTSPALPGRQARPRRHPGLRLRRRWRTSAASPSARSSCSTDPARLGPQRAAERSPRSSATSSPTCGSATS